MIPRLPIATDDTSDSAACAISSEHRARPQVQVQRLQPCVRGGKEGVDSSIVSGIHADSLKLWAGIVKRFIPRSMWSWKRGRRVPCVSWFLFPVKLHHTCELAMMYQSGKHTIRDTPCSINTERVRLYVLRDSLPTCIINPIDCIPRGPLSCLSHRQQDAWSQSSESTG